MIFWRLFSSYWRWTWIELGGGLCSCCPGWRSPDHQRAFRSGLCVTWEQLIPQLLFLDDNLPFQLNQKNSTLFQKSQQVPVFTRPELQTFPGSCQPSWHPSAGHGVKPPGSPCPVQCSGWRNARMNITGSSIGNTSVNSLQRWGCARGISLA